MGGCGGGVNEEASWSIALICYMLYVVNDRNDIMSFDIMQGFAHLPLVFRD